MAGERGGRAQVRALPREIGRVPRRDRSHSASKSVHFRVEIGRVPHRNRSHSTPSSGRSEKATRSAASRSESTKGAQHHHTSTVRSALVPIFPRTGIRRREHESQREPFLRPAAVNVRSASRSPFGSSTDSDGSDGAAHGRKIPSKSDSRFSLRFQGFSRHVNTSHHIPMCTEGVCTHGSKDNRTHQNLFSRDSKVSIGTDRGRMCNIVSIVRSAPEAAGLLQSHRNGHLQSRPCTPTDGRSGTSTFRSADRASRDTSKSRSSENPRRKRRAPPRTDLDAGFDRSRRGSGPISRRSTTDLGVRPSGPSGPSSPVKARQDQDAATAWPIG